MKQFDTLILGVVYPGVESFLQEYANSINQQDNQDFDVLIVNDGLSVDLQPYFKKTIKEVSIQGKQTPAQIRAVGLKYALEHEYQQLVFTDTDDYYSYNRIGACIGALETNDFVYNRMTAVNSKGEVLKQEYDIDYPSVSLSIEDVIDYNYLGLTNTALNLSFVKELDFAGNVVAFDWWLFSSILLKGAKGEFIEGVDSFYRQHDTNTVGTDLELNERTLEFGIKVKLLHYNALLKTTENLNQDAFKELIINKRDQISILQRKIVDHVYKSEYISEVNRSLLNNYRGWWSLILPPKK